MNVREIFHIRISRCVGVSTPPPILSVHTPPPLCPSCNLTLESSLYSPADTAQLPLSAAITYTQDLAPHPCVHIQKSGHIHQTQHLQTASLSILSWRQDRTQRVLVV